MIRQQEILIQLVRLGIETDVPKHSHINIQNQIINWEEIRALSVQHGVSAIVLDGLELLPEYLRPPQSILLPWIGEVLQNYDARYKSYRARIGELAEFYRSHGIKLMILKGYGLGLDYPKPSHRPYGDVDIWTFGKQKEADDALRKEFGIEIDKRHHHHTVFNWGGFVVENHYDFVNVHYGHNNKELEIVFKELAKEDSNRIEIDGQLVYLPCANLHALFLLRHNIQDFASAGINFRQVLDWAFFVKKHNSDIDWLWLEGMIEKFRMKDFFNCLNAICVEDLGFDTNIFNKVTFNPLLKEKVLKDIISPEYSRKEPKSFIPRILYKFNRWQGNAWKQELCYSESRTSSFFTGLWSHFLKPRSI